MPETLLWGWLGLVGGEELAERGERAEGDVVELHVVVLAEREFFEQGAGLFDARAVEDEDDALLVGAVVPLVNLSGEVEAQGGGDLLLEDGEDGGAVGAGV